MSPRAAARATGRPTRPPMTVAHAATAGPEKRLRERFRSLHVRAVPSAERWRYGTAADSGRWGTHAARRQAPPDDPRGRGDWLGADHGSADAENAQRDRPW